MPIRFDNEQQSNEQAVVSCQGDVEVLTFPPGEDGVAWLVLGDGEPGEPGRYQEDLSPRDLSAHRGVLVGFTDVRSVDVFLDALRLIRGQLVDEEPVAFDLNRGPRPGLEIVTGDLEEVARQVRDLTAGDLDLVPVSGGVAIVPGCARRRSPVEPGPEPGEVEDE